MDIEKICKNNLGRIVDYKGFKAKVIGYKVVGYNIVLECLILSLVEDCGWNDFVNSDIILLHSPLNRSHVLASIKWYKEQLIL